MSGLVHIYCGGGKGKTTAAMGLAVRCAGWQKRVLVAQLMKQDNSGERRILEQLPQGGRYYVTIDIDAFDYSIAGGTGSPMLGGLLYDEAVDLLEGIAQRRCSTGRMQCWCWTNCSPALPADSCRNSWCWIFWKTVRRRWRL